MNLFHRWLCSSGYWGKAVEQTLLPWSLGDAPLGEAALEVGSGYGAATKVLRSRVTRVTCVERDSERAALLRQRVGAGNVTVLCEDATKMSLPDASFDSALCFMMLHHVPSAAMQDQLLAEMHRTLISGGMLFGCDGRNGRLFRLIHLYDTVSAIDPLTFADRLEAAGFTEVEIVLKPTRFSFRARKR